MVDNTSQSFYVLDETIYTANATSASSCSGSKNTNNLSKSSTMSSKLINSKMYPSKSFYLNSNRILSASLNNVTSASASKSPGLMNKLSASLKKISISLGFSKQKVSAPDVSSTNKISSTANNSVSTSSANNIDNWSRRKSFTNSSLTNVPPPSFKSRLSSSFRTRRSFRRNKVPLVTSLKQNKHEIFVVKHSNKKSLVNSKNRSTLSPKISRKKLVKLDRNGVPVDKTISTLSKPTFDKSNLRSRRNSKRRKNITKASNPDIFDSFISSVKNSNMIQLDSSGKTDGKFCYVEGSHSVKSKPDYKVEGYILADEFRRSGKNSLGSHSTGYRRFVVFFII